MKFSVHVIHGHGPVLFLWQFYMFCAWCCVVDDVVFSYTAPYGGGGGHWLVWMEWRPPGWSVCLPLLISPCTINSRSSLLAPAHPGSPGKRAVKRLWCGGVGSVDIGAMLQQVVIYFQRLHQGAPPFDCVVCNRSKMCTMGKVWCLWLPCY